MCGSIDVIPPQLHSQPTAPVPLGNRTCHVATCKRIEHNAVSRSKHAQKELRYSLHKTSRVASDPSLPEEALITVLACSVRGDNEVGGNGPTIVSTPHLRRYVP